MSAQAVMILGWIRSCEYSDTFFRGYITGFLNAIKEGELEAWESQYLLNVLGQLACGRKV